MPYLAFITCSPKDLTKLISLVSNPLIKAFSFPYLIMEEEKSRNTASPVLLTPKPASHLSLAALDATSRGTKFPNAGYLLSR